MNEPNQLVLFKESTEDKLSLEVQYLREQYEKIRKSQFAKIAELRKLYLEAQYELETLKKAIIYNCLDQNMIQMLKKEFTKHQIF